MNAFEAKFKVKELLIAEVGGWNISLREDQPTLGSLILSLKRGCAKLGELTKSESEEFGEAVALIEKLYHATLKPEKVNYLALMMVDEHVHFHVIPRFSTAIQFEGVEYHDECWPSPHTLKVSQKLNGGELQKLRGFFAQQLSTSNT